jgi:hypothetical protein
MSAERMMENAMQEQPILLLPFFLLAYFTQHLLRQAGNTLLAHTFSTWLS